jgi:DNA primase
MIPIKDARGKVVAFGGRVLDDGSPKYLNTGETALFQKRELLFGLDIAIKAIRTRRLAVVVEGYMDAISLHAVGINYAVASLGTAFSKEHAKMLGRLVDTVVLSYDSDDAGKRNAVRAVSILKEAGVPVKVLTVPEVKDPDEFVRKYGKEAFEKLVTTALDGTEFQIRYTIGKNNNDNLAGKVKTVSNLIPFLIESKNTIARAGYVRLIAQLLTVDEDLIMGEYRKEERKIKTTVPAGFPVNKQQDAKSITATDQAERTLLRTLMQYSVLIDDYLEAVKQIGFANPIHQAIFDVVSTMSGKTLEEITDSFSDADDDKIDAEKDVFKDQVKAEVALIMMSDRDNGEKTFSNEHAQTMVRDCIRQMQHSQLDKEFEEHSKRAVAYEKAGDPRFKEELRMGQAVKDKIKRLYGDN